jgi:hypothetical protein
VKAFCKLSNIVCEIWEVHHNINLNELVI